jgi:hypothetical protein
MGKEWNPKPWLLTKDLSQPKVGRISRFSTSNPTNRKTIYGLRGSINGVPKIAKIDGLWGKIPSINGWWLEWLVYPYDLGNPHIYADWFQVQDFTTFSRSAWLRRITLFAWHGAVAVWDECFQTAWNSAKILWIWQALVSLRSPFIIDI